MSPKWAKLGPRWRQDAPGWGQHGHLETIWGAILSILGGLGSDLSKNGRSVKTNNSTPFLVFFSGVGASSGGSWRLSWEGFGSYVGRCWLQDGVFLDILGDVVASWCQDGAQERQDEAR